jgi:hypothetical protein
MRQTLKPLLIPRRLTCAGCKQTLRAKAPYLLQETSGGKLILLDRDYKPLGSDGRFAEYEDPKWADRLFDPAELKLDAPGLKRVGHEKPTEVSYYFYNDANSPHVGTKKDRERYVRLLEQVFPREALDRIAHLSATVAWE